MQLSPIDEGALGMRVESCLAVIHDVSARLADEDDVHPRIVEQLRRLDQLLSLIDHNVVTEIDLDRIEGATNQLMVELGTLFIHKGMGALYLNATH